MRCMLPNLVLIAQVVLFLQHRHTDRKTDRDTYRVIYATDHPTSVISNEHIYVYSPISIIWF